jgi:hypothetical protein
VTCAQEQERLNAQGYETLFDDEYGIDVYGEESAMLEAIRTLADQLAVVALYRSVELKTKNLLQLLYIKKLVDEEKITQWDKLKIITAERLEKKKLYRWDKLRETLNEHAIEHDHIANYNAVNDLRLLNNDIKHKNDWREGETLHDLEQDFRRLSAEVPAYIEDLATKVTKRLAAQSPPKLPGTRGRGR